MPYILLGIASLFCLTTTITGCAPEAGNQQESGSTGNSPLISVKGLKSLINDANLVLIDLGPEKEAFDKAHLPNAQYVDWVDDITDLNQPDKYKLVGKAEMEKLLGRLGVTRDSRIVLYDDMNSRVSVRMYWSLKFYGVDNVQVLNGGRPAWTQAGFSTTAEVGERQPTEFKIDRTNEKLSVDLDFIADRLQNPNVSLIDGRPKSQFTGDEPGKVFHTGALHNKRGHIPGAVNILWKDNFREDGTFKSIAELEKLYDSVTGSDMIVTYCNEGLHAAPPWFVLSELLGHGDVRIYDASLSEWANSDQPVEKSGDNSP